MIYISGTSSSWEPLNPLRNLGRRPRCLVWLVSSSFSQAPSRSGFTGSRVLGWTIPGASCLPPSAWQPGPLPLSCLGPWGFSSASSPLTPAGGYSYQYFLEMWWWGREHGGPFGNISLHIYCCMDCVFLAHVSVGSLVLPFTF